MHVIIVQHPPVTQSSLHQVIIIVRHLFAIDFDFATQSYAANLLSVITTSAVGAVENAPVSHLYMYTVYFFSNPP
ncbi:hypothetical protein V6Z12_D03G150300 [Gossypium hirsutum]